MKILLGVPEYPPHHIGGGGEVFKNLAEGYVKEGHKVIVVYGFYKAKYFDSIEKNSLDGITFYQVPEIPYPKKLPFLKTVMPIGIINYLKLKKIIKDEDVDIANLHGYGLFFINQLAYALNRLNVKYVLSLHGAPVSPDKMKGIIGLIYKIYKKILGSPLLKNALHITAVSKFTTTFPEFNKYKEKIHIIHNGINNNSYKYDSSFPLTIKKNIEEISFLSLGRIEWLKGFQLFMPILQKLKKSGLNVKYYIAGRDNNYKAELDLIIKKYDLVNNIVYLGFLDFQNKVNTVHECDYVVIPSLVENYPAVPIEAIICGKIPIGNKIGGIPEIINKNNGICTNFEDIESTYKKISKLINNKNITGNNNSNFGWGNIVAQYLKLYQK